MINSKANPAHFHPNWAGLAVLFSRQFLSGSQDFFFCLNILFFIYSFKYKTIETLARAFLTLNISAVGSVCHYIVRPEVVPHHQQLTISTSLSLIRWLIENINQEMFKTSILLWLLYCILLLSKFNRQFSYQRKVL